DNVETLYELVAEDVFFADPFNVIHGKAGFRRVFDHMYETCIEPRFTVSDVAHSKTASYLRWQMTGKLKSWPYSKLLFEGMTEVHVDSDGKICKHIDHWDSASQLLQFLPFIGAIVRPILALFRLKSA
ncbi:MAG: nuclear transport factor 2 family protein, partial [Candidatus Puniceispirillum sp.]|nr:nuclear transport factor 2 family protein [Candidatus Puniceispirillum sp.]